MRSSNIVTVGFSYREYVKRSRSPSKAAAASRGESYTYPWVRKRASLISWKPVRTCPAWTAVVAVDHSSGSRGKAPGPGQSAFWSRVDVIIPPSVLAGAPSRVAAASRSQVSPPLWMGLGNRMDCAGAPGAPTENVRLLDGARLLSACRTRG